MNRVVSLLLLMALQMAGCDASPDCSEVSLIDTGLVTPSPEQFQDLSGCAPRMFDLTDGILGEDDGALTIAWLLAHEPGSGEPPEEINRLRFTIDPCTNGKVVAGRVTTLEAIALRGNVPLSTLSNADDLKKIARSQGPGSNVIWFFGLDDAACCGQ